MFLLWHPWLTTTNLSYSFPILKLPPPPCAVLLVSQVILDAQGSVFWGGTVAERFVCQTHRKIHGPSSRWSSAMYVVRCYLYLIERQVDTFLSCFKKMPHWDMYTLYMWLYDRRKFRSLTSDNMDSCKTTAARKKMQRREMLEKLRNVVFFNDLWVGWVEK